MPVSVRKGEKGWLIVEKSSGKVKGHSDTKAKAEGSARARNYSVAKKRGFRYR